MQNLEAAPSSLLIIWHICHKTKNQAIFKPMLSHNYFMIDWNICTMGEYLPTILTIFMKTLSIVTIHKLYFSSFPLEPPKSFYMTLFQILIFGKMAFLPSNKQINKYWYVISFWRVKYLETPKKPPFLKINNFSKSHFLREHRGCQKSPPPRHLQYRQKNMTAQL